MQLMCTIIEVYYLFEKNKKPKNKIDDFLILKLPYGFEKETNSQNYQTAILNF